MKNRRIPSKRLIEIKKLINEGAATLEKAFNNMGRVTVVGELGL